MTLKDDLTHVDVSPKIEYRTFLQLLPNIILKKPDNYDCISFNTDYKVKD